tara:strand:- start:1028 stop:1465 length:438 start_codon:yes stop_codon:yes gene_type:complete
MLITKKIEIDMGHRVPNHKSKCRNLHGHRYVIEVAVDGEIMVEKGISNEGMVIDFGDLKKIILENIDEVFDHSLTLHNEDKFKPIFDKLVENGQKINYVNFIPTAENLAKHWFGLLKPKLVQRKIKLKFVRVWETPTTTATYGDQ